MEAKKLTANELNGLLPYAHSDELDYLRSLAFQLTPKALAVILGVGSGVTALALLESVQEDIALYGVDIDNFTALDHLAQAGHAGKLTLIDGLTRRAAARCTDNTVNLLVVDSCTQRDLKAWLPKVRSGGIMFFFGYGGRVRNVLENARAKLGVELARPGCSIVFRKV